MTVARRGTRGGIALFFRRLLGFVALLLLLTLLAVLLAERNHHRYRLRGDGGQLVVQRGLFLPVGFGRDLAGENDDQPPLPLPPGASLPELPSVDERAGLDHQLFDLLLQWAKPRLGAADPAEQALGMRYVRRLEGLASISETQRLQLRQIRAEIAFMRAHQTLASLQQQLQQVRADLQLAITMGSPRATAAQKLIETIDQKLHLLAPLLPQDAPATAAPDPAKM